MSFARDDAGDKATDTRWAIIDGDGSFRVEKGLPAGNYKITVYKGAMGTPKSTTIQIADVIEIPKARAVTVEVDAGKKSAKRPPLIDSRLANGYEAPPSRRPGNGLPLFRRLRRSRMKTRMTIAGSP